MHVIIAPHPDDDILCCSGIILKNNDNVRIIFVTDGSKGSFKREEQGKKLALIRMNEAYRALEKLGIKNRDNIIFLNIEDGTVVNNKDIVYRQLYSLLQELDVEAIYFPSPFELHPDHSETGKIILSIVNDLKWKRIHLYMYTIHAPIFLSLIHI